VKKGLTTGRRRVDDLTITWSCSLRNLMRGSPRSSASSPRLAAEDLERSSKGDDSPLPFSLRFGLDVRPRDLSEPEDELATAGEVSAWATTISDFGRGGSSSTQSDNNSDSCSEGLVMWLGDPKTSSSLVSGMASGEPERTSRKMVMMSMFSSSSIASEGQLRHKTDRSFTTIVNVPELTGTEFAGEIRKT